MTYTHARKRTYVGLCQMCLMNVPLRICNHSLCFYSFCSNFSSVASKADNELLVLCLLAIRCSAWCSFLNACQWPGPNKPYEPNMFHNSDLVLFVLFITSLAKEVMFLVELVSLSVCLFFCLFVCGQHYSTSYERIEMKFYGRVLSSTRKN